MATSIKKYEDYYPPVRIKASSQPIKKYEDYYPLAEKESLSAKKRKTLIKKAKFPRMRPARVKPPSLKRLKKRMESEFKDI